MRLILRAARSIHSALHGNGGMAQHMLHLCFQQARGVVFKRQVVFVFVHANAAETVSVGKLAELAQLVVVQRRLQFVGDVHECHASSISARARTSSGPAAAPFDKNRG